MTDSSEYLAKPSDLCCLSGILHEGTPCGTTKDVSGIPTYISEPPTGKANGHILLYFPDVWGFFNNGFLVMDAFARAGYLVLGLDYFMGDPVTLYRKDGVAEPGFDYEAWKAKHMAFADERTPKWVADVKSSFGKPSTKYACVGYCFGAPYVCNELAADTVTAGAFAHPAFLKEYHFENLTKPLFLSCAEVDHTFDTDSRNKAIDILRNGKKPYQLQLFSGVQHGFALRCDLSNPYEKHVKEQSLMGIVEFFDFWLSL